MKYFALFGIVSLALACGGTDETSPMTTAPAPLVAGPAAVAAPDGVEIAFTVSGKGSPALVFIHGWLCDQSFWAAQVEALSATNTVITIDLPGHGLSGMDRDEWRMLAYGADVQTVVEHLGLTEVVLFGHSMGGPVALEAARLMPDRVIGVVGVDSLHNAEAKYDPEQMKGHFAAYETDFVGTCGQIVASMFMEDADPALVERVTNDMCDGSPEIGVALVREFIEYEMGLALAAAEIPVQYINADKYPTDVEVNRKYHPNFDGIVMEGVGHFLMMEKPEEFNEVLGQTIANLDQPAK